jgi:hypothetical protein
MSYGTQRWLTLYCASGYYQNITLWFCSVPNVIIKSLYVILIIIILKYNIIRTSPILWCNYVTSLLSKPALPAVLYSAASRYTKGPYAGLPKHNFMVMSHLNVTVHSTHSYYTYGWLVTRNLCRELGATVHKGRWLCIVHRATTKT